MEKIILGGGIAGLIAAFYNEDSIIIANQIGGQMKSKILGPRILEVNKYSQKLLNDINYPVCKRIAKIGYFYDGKINDTICKNLREKYFIKSRCLNKCSNVPGSIMSDGKNTIEYFDINWDVLMNKLLDKICTRIRISPITRIDIENNTIIFGENKIEYSRLLSTIPAPTFFELAELKSEEELRYASKVFIELYSNNINMEDYDYVYFPDDFYMFHRVTKSTNGKVILEYTTNDIEKVLSRTEHISREYQILKIGQIQSGKVHKINNVDFIGRYAAWNHDIKTDDIVKYFCEGK